MGSEKNKKNETRILRALLIIPRKPLQDRMLRGRHETREVGLCALHVRESVLKKKKKDQKKKEKKKKNLKRSNIYF